MPLLSKNRGRGSRVERVDHCNLPQQGVHNMHSKSSWRSRAFVIAFVALLGALAIPAAAMAAAETFHRFEVDATATYTVTETCADGSTSTTFINVIAGHEEEQENRVSTLDNDFLNVRILNFRDCEGNFVNDFGFGPAEFTFSPVLQEAAVTGTVTTVRGGRTVAVDLSWAATSPLEVTNNTTTFEGFTGHFQGKRRDAVASGTVTVNGVTLVNGSTTDAELESLEDTNIRH